MLTICFADPAAGLARRIQHTLLEAGLPGTLVERVTIFDRPDIAFDLDENSPDFDDIVKATETVIDWYTPGEEFQP